MNLNKNYQIANICDQLCQIGSQKNAFFECVLALYFCPLVLGHMDRFHEFMEIQEDSLPELVGNKPRSLVHWDSATAFLDLKKMFANWLAFVYDALLLKQFFSLPIILNLVLYWVLNLRHRFKLTSKWIDVRGSKLEH